MRFWELVTLLRLRFPDSQEGLLMAQCQTGDRYVTLGTPRAGGHIGVLEAGALPAFFPTEARACVAALLAFETYATRRQGVLYWRRPPELVPAPVGKGLRVGLRLVITTAPVIWPNLDAFLDVTRDRVRCTKP